jgi:hypothetical protein
MTPEQHVNAFEQGRARITTYSILPAPLIVGAQRVEFLIDESK